MVALFNGNLSNARAPRKDAVPSLFPSASRSEINYQTGVLRRLIRATPPRIGRNNRAAYLHNYCASVGTNRRLESQINGRAQPTPSGNSFSKKLRAAINRGPRITIITEATTTTTTTNHCPPWRTRIYLSRGIEQLNVKMITEQPARRL